MGSVQQKFSQVLREALETRKVVCFYHNEEETDRFDVGLVEELTSSEVLFQCLNTKGEPDGHMTVRIEDLDVIEFDDPYSKKIALLHEYQGAVFPGKDAKKTLPPLGSFGLLERALETREFVTIQDNRGNSFSGFVKELGDDFLTMELVTAYGELGGTAVILRECVIQTEVGRREEQIRAFLYQYHHGLKKLLGP